ncbi:MAG: hypothetical protein OHK0029_39320 [Armatimonadaceae bacterium]
MNSEERKQLAHLRLRALNGEKLTPEEQDRVALFVQVMEEEEAVRLSPAFERTDQAIADETERQQRLLQLREREKAIYSQLQKIVEEIEAIDSERRSLVRTEPV